MSNAKQSLNRRDFIKIAGASALLGSISSECARPVPRRIRPKNILLIITDQQHHDAISAGGCPYVHTPAMDTLLQTGMSFLNSYSTNPVCSPARSSIFTGRTTCETGVYKNGIGIRKDIPNLGQWLSETAGYETIYAGKWHVPQTYTQFIPGFKVINTGIGGLGYFGDTAVSRACEGYIRNHDKSKSFFLVASFLQPHDICEWLRLNTENPAELRYPAIRDDLPPLPSNFNYDLNEPEAIKNRRERSDPSIGRWDREQWQYYRWSYYRHIEFIDAEIGRVVQALDDFGYTNDTLVLLTSDHGEGMGHHQFVRKNSPYDESARVPLVLSWPGQIPEDQSAEQLVSGLDIVATVCEYAGIESPPNQQGKSLVNIIEGRQGKRSEFVVSELISNTQRMIRSKRFKYIHCKDDPVEILFDMQNDPDETKNLANDPGFANALSAHRQMLREWEKGLDPARDVPHVEYWRNI